MTSGQRNKGKEHGGNKAAKSKGQRESGKEHH